MDANTLEMHRRLQAASKEAARKAVSGQTVTKEDVDDLAGDITLAWIEQEGVRPAESGELLEFARAKGLVSASRKARDKELKGVESDYRDSSPLTGVQKQPGGGRVAQPEAASLASVSSDPMTRCDPMPESNPTLSRLKQSKRPSEKMYYLLYRLHEGKRVFPGQPAQLSRRRRHRVLPHLPPEWCTQAHIDLLVYHFYGQDEGCPTCKRIAAYIRGVTQNEVYRTINYIVEEIRLKSDR